MGSGFSTADEDGSDPAKNSRKRSPGLGELPENCLAMVLSYLDPPDICNLARTNRAFYHASSADFIWESKLPENYRILARKLVLYDGSLACFGKKDIYAGLCSPVRFSSGTKEVWIEKKSGGMCMLVSWKGMKITGIDDRRYWSHIPTLQSRFYSIAYLKQMWWLEVEGDVEFEFPPSTPRSSRMDSDQLHRIFQMFDKNGDSRITKQELNESLENMGIFIPDSDLVKMIENIDENNDGCVDIDEFGALYKSIMDDRENEEDVMEAFNVFDQNRDGFITVEELRSVLESLGLKQGRQADDCRRMIMKVDVDGDGMVSFTEFKEMMRSGGFSAMAQN